MRKLCLCTALCYYLRMNLARDDLVEADNLAAGHRDIGLRRICLLGAQRMADEKAIELGLSAGELLDGVGAIDLFDMRRIRHGSVLGSKTDGSRNSRSSRGGRRGGASK